MVLCKLYYLACKSCGEGTLESGREIVEEAWRELDETQCPKCGKHGLLLHKVENVPLRKADCINYSILYIIVAVGLDWQQYYGPFVNKKDAKFHMKHFNPHELNRLKKTGNFIGLRIDRVKSIEEFSL